MIKKLYNLVTRRTPCFVRADFNAKVVTKHGTYTVAGITGKHTTLPKSDFDAFGNYIVGTYDLQISMSEIVKRNITQKMDVEVHTISIRSLDVNVTRGPVAPSCTMHFETTKISPKKGSKKGYRK